jgi:hypothetical protein
MAVKIAHVDLIEMGVGIEVEAAAAAAAGLLV